MDDFLALIADNADAGLAVLILAGILGLVVLGHLVTARHLADWREFASKQEERANAAETALRDQSERDQRFYDLLQQLNQTIITALSRDRS